MRKSRVIFFVTALAATVFSATGNRSLIDEDTMSTYRQALAERSAPKASAFLLGLVPKEITVGIDSRTLPDDGQDFVEGVRDGIEIWNTSLREEAFRFVEAGPIADVIIRFVPRVKDGDGVQGFVNAQRSFYWRGNESGAKLVGTIQIRNNVDRRPMREDEVSRVAGHELGHLLGLGDDPDGAGLMADFMAGPGHKKPSREELDSVIEFRQLVRTALKSRSRSPKG
jgi:hypothetical protein